MARTKAMEKRRKANNKHIKIDDDGKLLRCSSEGGELRVYQFYAADGQEFCLAVFWSRWLGKVLYLNPEPLDGPTELTIMLDTNDWPWLGDIPPVDSIRLRVPIADAVHDCPVDLLEINNANLSSSQWSDVCKACLKGPSYPSVFLSCLCFLHCLRC